MNPQYAAGLTTALDRPCPVNTCRAAVGAICTTPITMRPANKRGASTPITLSGPHYQRIMAFSRETPHV